MLKSGREWSGRHAHWEQLDEDEAETNLNTMFRLISLLFYICCVGVSLFAMGYFLPLV